MQYDTTICKYGYEYVWLMCEAGLTTVINKRSREHREKKKNYTVMFHEGTYIFHFYCGKVQYLCFFPSHPSSD